MIKAKLNEQTVPDIPDPLIGMLIDVAAAERFAEALGRYLVVNSWANGRRLTKARAEKVAHEILNVIASH